MGFLFCFIKDVLSVLMLACLVTIGGHFRTYKNGRRRVFSCFVHFLMKKLTLAPKSVLNMSSSNSQIDKPQRGYPKRAELPDVNINTGVQSINAERASLKYDFSFEHL